MQLVSWMYGRRLQTKHIEEVVQVFGSELELRLAENPLILLDDHVRHEQLMLRGERQPQDIARIATGNEKSRHYDIRVENDLAHLLRTLELFFETFPRSSAMIASIWRMVSLSVPFFSEMRHEFLSQSGAGATVST